MAVPIIVGIGPVRGIIAGGTEVAVLGAGMATATRVQFGGIDCASFAIDDDTQLRAIAPPHAAGAVSVVVTNTDGPSSGSTYTFYTPVIAGEPAKPRIMLEAAFGALLTLDGPEAWTWTDITKYVLDNGTAVGMRRGRQEDNQTFDGGTLTAVLDNRDSFFDPTYYASAGSSNFPSWDDGFDPMVGQLPSLVRPETPIRYSWEYPWIDTSILPNGGFENGLTGWGAPTGSINSVVSDPVIYYDIGKHSAKCFFVSNAAGNLPGNAFVVQGGVDYALTGRVHADAYGFAVRLEVNFYSDAGATVLVGTWTVDGNPDGGGGWLRLGIQDTAPSTAIRAKVNLRTTTGVNTQHLWWDSVVFASASFQGVYEQGLFFADSWMRDWDIGESTCILSATDGFKPLSTPSLNSRQYIDALMALGPDHHLRLSEPGKNNESTNFADYVTGTVNRAHSIISTGVGPLYNVAGAIITDVDGAFSSLGPSSADSGCIVVDASVAINNGASDWTKIIWFRAPTQDFLTQFSTETTVWTEGILNVTSYLEFGLQWAFAQQAVFFAKGAVSGGTTGQVICDLQVWGFNLFDQVPHMFVVVHTAATERYDVYCDGVLVGFDLTATPVTITPQQGLMLGNAWLLPSPPINNAPKGEIDEYTTFKSRALTEPEINTLFDLARKLYPAEYSGSRIHRILDLCHWPASLRNIDTGSSVISNIGVPFTAANPLQYLQSVEASEQGWLFIDKHGAVRWIERKAFYATTGIHGSPQATFGSFAGEIPFSKCKPVDDDRTIVNVAEYAIENGGAVQRAVDAESEAEFFVRTEQRTVNLVADRDALGAAVWTVHTHAHPNTRLTPMELDTNQGEATVYQCCIRDIGDMVKVNLRPPGINPATPESHPAHITGITHTVKRGTINVTMDLSTLSIVDVMFFGDDFGSKPMGW